MSACPSRASTGGPATIPWGASPAPACRASLGTCVPPTWTSAPASPACTGGTAWMGSMGRCASPGQGLLLPTLDGNAKGACLASQLISFQILDCAPWSCTDIRFDLKTIKEYQSDVRANRTTKYLWQRLTEKCIFHIHTLNIYSTLFSWLLVLSFR